MSPSSLRTKIHITSTLDEHRIVNNLLEVGALPHDINKKIVESARELVESCRQDPSRIIF